MSILMIGIGRAFYESWQLSPIWESRQTGNLGIGTNISGFGVSQDLCSPILEINP